MAQYDVDLRDYWRIIKKRKVTIVLIVCLVGIASYGFARLKEPAPLYKTNAAIKIATSEGLATMFGQGYWSRGESLDTHAYILSSFSVLEQAAKEAGMIPADLAIEEIRLSSQYMGIIQRLKGMIQTVQEQGTNVINIWVTSGNPEEAALVANATAVAYRNYNIQEKNRKTIETRSFIEKQLKNTADDLRNAETELRQFEESNVLVLLNEQAFSTSDSIQQRNLGGQLNTVSAELEMTQKEIRELSELIQLLERSESDKGNVLNEGSFSSFVGTRSFELTARLRDLLRKRQILLVDFTEKHPQVVEISDQIRGAISTTKKELLAHQDTLKGKVMDLSAKLTDLKQANIDIPGKTLRHMRLKRNVTLYETLYFELKSKYQNILIQESGRVEEVSIVRPALVPNFPFNKPSKGRIVMTGIVMGLILGFVAAFGIEVFDTSIGTIEDVESLLEVPVLGVIPYLEKDGDKRGAAKHRAFQKERKTDLITHYDPRSLIAEAFRYLRTNLQFISVDKKNKTFLVTSSFIQEGKTFNVVNLALSMAQAGKQVLLVETDLRKPMIHRSFGLSKSPGLTEYVLGNYHWTEVRNSITDVMLGEFELEEIIKTPGLDSLNIITAGSTPPNPSEILRSDRFASFLKEAYGMYDIILLDSPPILPVADASDIAPLVDGVVLIYTVGKIGRGILKRAKLSLENVRANVIGIVLNNVKPEIGPDYFKYHSKYYYGAEEGKQTLGKRFSSSPSPSGTFSRVLPYMALFLSASAITIGIFWNEIAGYLSVFF